MARDVDRAWQQYGLNAYIGAPYHYYVSFSLCCLPFILIVSLLCCVTDDDEVMPPTIGNAGLADHSKVTPAQKAAFDAMKQ